MQWKARWPVPPSQRESHSHSSCYFRRVSAHLAFLCRQLLFQVIERSVYVVLRTHVGRPKSRWCRGERKQRATTGLLLF